MKIVEASNKSSLKLSREEWEVIGKRAGWIKSAQQLNQKAIQLLLQSQDPELAPIIDALKRGDIAGASQEYLRLIQNLKVASAKDKLVVAGTKDVTKKTLQLLYTLFSVGQMFVASPDLDQNRKNDIENAAEFLKKYEQVVQSKLPQQLNQKQPPIPQVGGKSVPQPQRNPNTVTLKKV